MKTAGGVLKYKREKIGLTVEQAANRLKIQEKYIIALESDNSAVFDSRVIARGFLIKYCRFLSLDPDKILPFWRRDFTVVTKHPHQEESIKKRLRVTPAIFSILIVLFIVLAFITVGYVQYLGFKRPPRIDLYSPKDGQSLQESFFELSGHVNGASELFLNNTLIDADSNGRFFENIEISSGSNKFTLKAVSPLGRESSLNLTIYGDFQTPKNKSTPNSENDLVVTSLSTSPVFIEVKSSDTVLFSGFLLENSVKRFSGDSLFFYTDTIEGLAIKYKDEPVDTGESKFGVFIKEFNQE
jgi:cytoskeletal protein RodZ